MKNVSFNDLNEKDRELLLVAKEAMYNAYSPYSKFMVGAALRSADGDIVKGANVENAAGTSICAERSAIVAANAMGKRTFDTIAIIAKGQDYDAEEPTAPCGSCRQVLFETSQISKKDINIILSNTNMNKIIVTSISELLPLAFGPNNLNIDLESYRK